MITKTAYKVTNETLKQEVEENKLTINTELMTPVSLAFNTLREALDYIEEELGGRKYSIERVVVPDAKAMLQIEIAKLEMKLQKKREELETL